RTTRTWPRASTSSRWIIRASARSAIRERRIGSPRHPGGSDARRRPSASTTPRSTRESSASPTTTVVRWRDGESSDVQALAGVRVLELTAAMAGPWIGRFMAACGAEVIRVESRTHPDVVRLYVPPRAPERGIQPRDSPWFTDWNAGKLFVALDLARPKAIELFLRLVTRADVVVSNYSAGVMARLGLDYERLRRANEKIVVFATSGYGETGPCSSYVTWGPNIEALSGLGTLSGFPERECTITQYAYPDVLTAL